jgi:hypothetical protein
MKHASASLSSTPRPLQNKSTSRSKSSKSSVSTLPHPPSSHRKSFADESSFDAERPSRPGLQHPAHHLAEAQAHRDSRCLPSTHTGRHGYAILPAVLRVRRTSLTLRSSSFLLYRPSRSIDVLNSNVVASTRSSTTRRPSLLLLDSTTRPLPDSSSLLPTCECPPLLLKPCLHTSMTLTFSAFRSLLPVPLPCTLPPTKPFPD